MEAKELREFPLPELDEASRYGIQDDAPIRFRNQVDERRSVRGDLSNGVGGHTKRHIRIDQNLIRR